jgi:hypothetical protein
MTSGVTPLQLTSRVLGIMWLGQAGKPASPARLPVSEPWKYDTSFPHRTIAKKATTGRWKRPFLDPLPPDLLIT